ncbi:uncharacterized protein LOC110536975 [Oncorhynchus mykiss]|uniref:uncharacterized protein LOC110536975 n=1 Tax=Oncorhynchus mykiss TaxID=8022 RepID=UPI0018784B74|nr:uncharacterized protein LOC110536975 [Oncorhynchus mykiss]
MASWWNMTNTQRSLGYYLVSLLMWAPFMKHPLKAVLKGITNDPIDFSDPIMRNRWLEFVGSQCSGGPPSQHHLIRLPVAVVGEMYRWQQNMQHSEDFTVSITMNGSVSQLLASIRLDKPVIDNSFHRLIILYKYRSIFDGGPGADQCCNSHQWGSGKDLTSSLTSCLLTNGHR